MREEVEGGEEKAKGKTGQKTRLQLSRWSWWFAAE